MATAGRMSGLLIQALRYLSAKQVNDEMIANLRRRLRPRDHKQRIADAPLAPAWIADVMRAIAAPAGR
jgi:hypothetical protein